MGPFNAVYIGDNDRRSPTVTPLRADFKGLAPVFIRVSSWGLLRFARMLAEGMASNEEEPFMRRHLNLGIGPSGSARIAVPNGKHGDARLSSRQPIGASQALAGRQRNYSMVRRNKNIGFANDCAKNCDAPTNYPRVGPSLGVLILQLPDLSAPMAMQRLTLTC